MEAYTFDQLVDLEQMRQLLTAHHHLSGMACGLMDTEGNTLVAVGWQDICAQFHRVHPVTCARCNENASYLNAHVKDAPDGMVEHGCGNRMVDIAMPIFFDGRHQATFVTGQFFYEDNPPDRDFYTRQAEALGFDKAEYLAALDEVPVFSREHVHGNLLLLRHLVQMLGDASLKSLRLAREMKEREQVEHRVALLSFALNQVREAAFLIDEHARFHFVNEEACRILGYPREALLGMGVADVDPDATAEGWSMHWRKLRECQSLMFEGRHRTHAGRIFPVEVHANFIEYDGQQFNLALVRDITERKRAEQRLMMREREFRALAENSPDNIARYDCGGRLLYANPALLDLLGCTLQERLGKMPAESDAGEVFGGYQEALLQVAATGESKRFEFTYDVGGSMRTHWIHMVAELGEDGRPAAVLAVGRDISAIKRAERELQHSRAGLAEAQRIAQLGSWEMSYGDEQRLTWSDEMFEIHAVDKRDFDRSPESMLAIVHPEDRNRVNGVRIDALGGQRDRYDVSYRLLTPDGRTKFVHEQGRNAFDAHGRPIRSVGTVQDITHQQEIELQLLQAQKMEAVGTLVGGIAHDFNNKLAAINANLYLAKRSVDSHSSAAQRLAAVETLSFEAADMVRQLLTFARKGKIELMPLPLVDFIKEMTRLNRVAIPEDIHLAVDYGEHPLPVVGDATQLQQVFLNLLTNARDALKGVDQPRIGISMQRCEPDADFFKRHPEIEVADAYACVQVRDNGMGIEPEHLDQIFEPFFTTKDVDQGTGLGLAMVYGVIRAHHGVIEVESEPGTGTCFSIYLPIRAASSSDKAVREESIVEGDGETILLADDDAQVLDVLGELLASINYRVLKAGNGHEAVSLFRRHAHEIDLVILDIVMPEMKGPKVARLIRETRPDVKLLYATGYDRLAGDEGLGPEAEVLGKPYAISQVSRTIRQLLGRECCS